MEEEYDFNETIELIEIMESDDAQGDTEGKASQSDSEIEILEATTSRGKFR